VAEANERLERQASANQISPNQTPAGNENAGEAEDFIREIIREDVRKGTHGGEVLTRFFAARR